jgi:flagellar FliJ protein
MKRFSFRLDSILDYRRYLEKRAQRDLVAARNEQMLRKKAAESLVVRRRETAQACRAESLEGMDVPRYHIYKSFLLGLDQDLEKAHTGLREGENTIRAKEEVLKKKTVEKRVLEVLKDLQRRAHRLKAERAEQKNLDELVIMRKGGRA